MPHFTIRQKLIVGMGLPVLLLIGLGLGSFLQGRRVARAIRDVTEVHEPLSNASLEMEASLAETSAALLGYLHDHDPKHLERIATGAATFNRFQQQYRRLAAAANREARGPQLGDDYRHLWELATVLAEVEDRQRTRIATVQSQLTELETLLDQALWSVLRTGEAGSASQPTPFILEMRVNRLARSFSKYLRTHQPDDEARLRREVEEALGALERLEPSDPASTHFAKGHPILLAVRQEIDEVLEMEHVKVDGLARFERLRRELDATLDEQVQAPVQRTLAAVNQTVHRAAAAMELLILTLLGLSLLLALANGALLWRSITAPMSRLLTVMRAMAAGDLTQRASIGSRDEFSALGATFDHMAAQLHTLECELREAVKLKGEFSAAVSHELRSPLASIKQTIDIVEDGTCGPLGDEQREYLRIAKQNVDRLALLINDLLDFQKLEAGRMPMHLAPHDLSALAQQAVHGFALVAKHKGVKLSARQAEALPAVSCDKDRIMQVLTNLINNAIKFTDHGTILVATERQDGGVRCSVQDSGIGIREEDHAKLFRQFSQLEGGQGHGGGTGLGLAICKQIIEQHGGAIGVTSTYGHGSAFFFTLPAPPEASARARQDAQ